MPTANHTPLTDIQPRFVTSFPFQQPSFITAHASPAEHKAGSNGTVVDLIISSFGVHMPWASHQDGVYFIPSIAQAMGQGVRYAYLFFFIVPLAYRYC